MILVDLSSLLYTALNAMPGDIQENLFRHMVLNSLRMYNLKYRDKYGLMVVAADAGNVWRKDVFKQYKASRKDSRDADTRDWTEIFRIFGQIKDEIKNFIPCKYVWVDGCEADDIIATLVKGTQEFGAHEEVMIISADGDYAQLQKYSNVKQFSPRTGKLVSDDNPVRSLREKVLRGDKGDGIPNVLSDDSCFVDGVRQTTLSSKKLEAFLESWDNLPATTDDTILARIHRNRRLIDFDFIPEDKQAQINKEFNEAKIPLNRNVFTYLIQSRCGKLASSAADFFSPEI